MFLIAFLSRSGGGEEGDEEGEEDAEESEEEETVDDPDEGFSGDLSLPGCPNAVDEFSLSDADIEDLLSDRIFKIRMRFMKVLINLNLSA